MRGSKYCSGPIRNEGKGAVLLLGAFLSLCSPCPGEDPYPVAFELPRGQEPSLLSLPLVDVEQARSILVKFRVESDRAGTLSSWLILRDAEGWWYQCELDAEPEEDGWNTFRASLERGSSWVPFGHAAPWEASIAMNPIQELSLLVQWNGRSGATLQVECQPTEGDPGEGRSEPVRLAEFTPFPRRVPVYGMCELRFLCSPEVEHPFLPEQVPASCVVRTPSGGEDRVDAFASRDYLRTLRRNRETLTPVGSLHWKIRYCPLEEGTHRYNVYLRGRETAVAGGAFEAEPSEKKGLVKRCADAPRWFELSEGDFFYPVGINLRAFPGRGTWDALPMVDSLARAGGNWCRTWMCAWWTALEWSHEYESHYHGLGKYSLQNAWKLDRFLEACERNDVYVQLVLNNHGQFSLHVDSEWKDNPYNSELGGPLETPEDYFIDERAKELFRNRLLYILSRYGAYSHIMAWELWNEVDLTHQYQSDWSSIWHVEMARFLRTLDPYRHLITTHFVRARMDPLVWSLREIEYTQSDAYNDADIVRRLEQVCRAKSPFEKPHIANEFWRQGEFDSRNHLHCGLWASYFLPLSASAMAWEWRRIRDLDWMEDLSPFVSFSERADRRAVELSPFPVETPREDVKILALAGTDQWTLWIYRAELPEAPDDTAWEEIQLSFLQLKGLPEGLHAVEWIDPWSGQVIEARSALCEEGVLYTKPPPFARDVVCWGRSTGSPTDSATP